MYEVSSTDFLSEKPHVPYGAARRPSTADRKMQFANWRRPSGNGEKAAIETTCYALIALSGDQGLARQKAIDLLLRTQNPNGWPKFELGQTRVCGPGRRFSLFAPALFLIYG
jgi:hypothetical protein